MSFLNKATYPSITKYIVLGASFLVSVPAFAQSKGNQATPADRREILSLSNTMLTAIESNFQPDKITNKELLEFGTLYTANHLKFSLKQPKTINGTEYSAFVPFRDFQGTLIQFFGKSAQLSPLRKKWPATSKGFYATGSDAGMIPDVKIVSIRKVNNRGYRATLRFIDREGGTPSTGTISVERVGRGKTDRFIVTGWVVPWLNDQN